MYVRVYITRINGHRVGIQPGWAAFPSHGMCFYSVKDIACKHGHQCEYEHRHLRVKQISYKLMKYCEKFQEKKKTTKYGRHPVTTVEFGIS